MEKNITIITSHVNPDFDAIGSMLAAQKLYPEAFVVFPKSNGKNLRNFFIDSMAYLYNMADIKDIDVSRLKRLVIVDTRQKQRIGQAAKLLAIQGIEIHIYDHHPQKAGDMKGNFEVNAETGATVTIILNIIKEKGIEISHDEATMMCLGLYEDTGSFTFSSTKEDDFKAAAFLVSKGADLNIVSSLISREIQPEQVELLHDMIQYGVQYNINDVKIVITAISSEKYTSNLAFIVHKAMKVEKVDAFFAIVQMENKIYVIARSKTPQVDAGSVLSVIGGGGHWYAASAVVKDMTLTETEHRLFAIINGKINHEYRAEDIMSFPPIMVETGVCLKEAEITLTRYNVNALLVMSGKKLAGFITRQIIDKGLYHNLGQVPVEEYMNSEISSVQRGADISEIREKIIENKQRILPVVDSVNVVGVITRTDILKVIARNFVGAEKETVHARVRNVSKNMRKHLEERLLDILKEAGLAAEELKVQAYVIGGFVRDLLLQKENDDIDIVIEGDGIEFAKHFSKIKEASLHIHEKFGTAVITFKDGFKIDVASARTEYYKSPAALPTVRMSSLKLDMFRRDFTINTLAIHINPSKFGVLIDFFSAQNDLKEKVIRALHNLSFVEDPTRIFRAVRFEQRFGFSIGKLTLRLINNAVKMDFLKRLSPARIFAEFRQILEEENLENALLRLKELDILNSVHKKIMLNDKTILMFKSAKTVISWYNLLFKNDFYLKWMIYFMLLIKSCDKETSEEICEHFKLSPVVKNIFCTERFDAQQVLNFLCTKKDLKNSEIYEKLSPFKIEILIYMMSVTENEKIKRYISNYCSKLRFVKTSVTGKDLIKMGIKPGPLYTDILKSLLEAKLDGKANTKEEELTFADKFLNQSN